MVTVCKSTTSIQVTNSSDTTTIEGNWRVSRAESFIESRWKTEFKASSRTAAGRSIRRREGGQAERFLLTVGRTRLPHFD